MLASIFVRKAALGLSLAVALPVAALAQTSYPASGGEYPIPGPLPGDQVHPQLALGPSGGFLVWQDNALARYGLGVGAVALDNTLKPAGRVFRVNKIGFGDDENPRAALLNAGGAAFVWQGGPINRQHIYARLLSSANAWLAPDTLVNSATNCSQRDPALATLANGNVAIVYSSLNQQSANSRLDIYGQILSPSGDKVGAEFLVNQFTPFNQRTPAVAALPGGGFVVAWVSEQNRSGGDPSTANTSTNGFSATRATTDIYARIYSAAAAPASDEFLVSSAPADGSSVCATPAVAAGADGSFIIAWGQRTVELSEAGWDIFLTPFSPAGTPGPSQRVNTYTTGDQYAPQLASLGNTFLAAWTSLGQDGSFEGVYAQLLQSTGSPSGSEFRVNSALWGAQKQPAIAADNYGQFLAVWTSFVPANRGVDLFSQAYAQPGLSPFSPTNHYGAPPAETFVDTDLRAAIASGKGPTSMPSGVAILGPPSSNTGNPVTTVAAGAYNGLIYDPSGVNTRSAGYVSVKLTSGSTFSGKMTLAGASSPLSGSFDATGHWSKTIASKSVTAASFEVSLQLANLGSSGADQIQGTVKNPTTSTISTLLADRCSPNPASVGAYTFIIAPTDNSPAGSGYGTINVDARGGVKVAIALPDGSKASQGTTLSSQSYLPLYANPYGGQGLLISWVQLPPADPGGSLIWIKPAFAPSARLFPGSFTNTIALAVSRHSSCNQANALLNGKPSSLTFSGAGLSPDFTPSVALDSRGKLNPPSRDLSLSLSCSSGLFTGKAKLLSGAKISFQGVFLDNDNRAAGFFVNNGVSGNLDWRSAP